MIRTKAKRKMERRMAKMWLAVVGAFRFSSVDLQMALNETRRALCKLETALDKEETRDDG